MFLVSCSSSLQQRQAADDLYYTPDKNQNRDIIKEFEEDYNKAIAENEQKDKQEATQNDTVMDFKKSTNPYEKILVDDMNEAYDKRQEAMRDPYYGMNNYYSVRFSDDYWYASSFDPMFYNTVVMGNTVWVEPNWMSSHFRHGYNYGSFYNYGGFYNRPYSSWGFGFSHHPYSMNSFYPYNYGYGYGYNYYGYSYGYGGYNGFYNPYSQSNFYNYERRRTPYELSVDNSDTKEINRIRSANNSTSRKITRIKNTEKEDPRIRTIRTRNADERANEDNSLRIRRSRANSNSARAENRNNQINSNNGTTLRRVIQENRNSTSKEIRYRTKPNSEANPKRLRNNIRKTKNNNYSNNNYNSSNNSSNNSSGSIRSTGSSSSNSSSGSSSSGSSSSSSSGRRR